MTGCSKCLRLEGSGSSQLETHWLSCGHGLADTLVEVGEGRRTWYLVNRVLQQPVSSIMPTSSGMKDLAAILEELCCVPQSCVVWWKRCCIDCGLQQICMDNIYVFISWYNDDDSNICLSSGVEGRSGNSCLCCEGVEGDLRWLASTRIGVTGYNRIHHIVDYVSHIIYLLSWTTYTTYDISKLYHLELLINIILNMHVCKAPGFSIK